MVQTKRTTLAPRHRSEQRISRHGRSQQSSRSATDSPQRERTERRFGAVGNLSRRAGQPHTDNPVTSVVATGLVLLASMARGGKVLGLINAGRLRPQQPLVAAACRGFPNWLRQRVGAIIWTLKNQLGLERRGGRVPTGLWARVAERLLALNAAIWHN